MTLQHETANFHTVEACKVVKAFEEIVDRLPEKTVRLFGKRLLDMTNDVKERGIARMNAEIFSAECAIIFQLAKEKRLPQEHMALVNQLREHVQ